MPGTVRMEVKPEEIIEAVKRMKKEELNQEEIGAVLHLARTRAEKKS